MRKYIFFLTIFSLAPAQSGSEEFRATWVISWDHISPSDSPSDGKTRIREILDNHVDANMNAVFFQVRQSGTAYYNSSFEPWGYYAGYDSPGYDPLAYAIEQAHLRGLELHAWFNTFQTSSTYSGTPSAEHPEWVCRDRSGIPMDAYRALSPGLEDVRNYTIAVAMEIVNNYDIDGLHLDYIRWNEHSNGNNQIPISHEDELKRLDGIISDDELNALQERTGRYLYDINHPYSGGTPSGFNSWEEWWRNSVTTFVQTLHDSIQSVKPFVRLSTAVLGKYNWSSWQGYGTVYQDGALWFNEGYVDQLTPMHYHWTNATGFHDMLEGDCPQCWSQYIQVGINAERMFTVGPGSYILENNGVWNNHASIINTCRTVDWTDGFQFFSYGSWKDQLYWDEAGHTFFSQKSKIRLSHPFPESAPNAPNLSLDMINDLNYDLIITASDTNETDWIILYRSEDENVDINSSKIVGIYFDSSPVLYSETFDGLQSFDSSYYYAATSANRFWNESSISNMVHTENIPSFPPSILSTNPTDGTIINVSEPIQIIFSKEMEANNFEDKIAIFPPLDFSLTWSEHWSDFHKRLTLNINSSFEMDETYIVDISGEATDILGYQLDGNNDGIGGDSFTFSFTSPEDDIWAPSVLHFYPGPFVPFDTEDVITVVFDELINEETVNAENITLHSSQGSLGTDLVLTSLYFNQSILNIRSFSPLIPETNYTLNLSSIQDTAGNEIANVLSFLFDTNINHYTEINMMDDFTVGNGWWQAEQSGSTVGIIVSQTEFGYTQDNYLPGSEIEPSQRKSASLEYVWDETASDHLLRIHNAGSPATFQIDTSYTLQCFLYGDSSLNQFRFSLYETGPNTAEVSNWLSIDWVGWKLIEWDLGNANEVGVWIGNGIMDGSSYHLDGLHMTWADAGAIDGQIFIDDLRFVKKSSGEFATNYPPIITQITGDSSTAPGNTSFINVYFTDDNANDSHLISATSNTAEIITSVQGHSSGSRINLSPSDAYLGDAEIQIIVKDLGMGELSDTAYFNLSVLSINGGETVPIQYSLGQNYPNPFNGSTNIPFTIQDETGVQLTLYDLKGQYVNTLVNKRLKAGIHNQMWNGLDFSGHQVASGIYYYQLVCDDYHQSKKMVFLK